MGKVAGATAPLPSLPKARRNPLKVTPAPLVPEIGFLRQKLVSASFKQEDAYL